MVHGRRTWLTLLLFFGLLWVATVAFAQEVKGDPSGASTCLLYTSDAADE